jgi:hypothetical protein
MFSHGAPDNNRYMYARSNAVRSAALVLAVAAFTPLAAPAADALPARPAPAGLRAVGGNAGGRILDGNVAGPAGASPAGAFRAGIALVRTYFDAPPQILGAVRSSDRTLTLGLFKATLDGAPVGGFVLTTYVPKGPSRVDVLFDRSDRVNRSMPALLTQAAGLHPAASGAGDAGSAMPAMHDVVSPDGTVHARIPDGWKTPIFTEGQLGAMGPGGDEVDQEITIRCVDPRGSIARSVPWLPVPYTQDVEQAFLNVLGELSRRGAIVVSDTRVTSAKPGPPMAGASVAQLAGTDVLHGVTRRFEGLAAVGPIGPAGGWSLTVKMVAAPADRFDREFPTLKAVYESYNVDQQARGAQVAQSMREDREGMARAQAMSAATIARNTAVFNASMSHARDVQQSIDRSTSGFVHYLNDTTVLEGPGGARGTADAGFAQSIVSSNPQNFRIVPVSEYRPGD